MIARRRARRVSRGCRARAGRLVWIATLFCLSRIGGAASEKEYPVAPFRIIDRQTEAGIDFDYLTEKQSSGGSDEVDYSNTTFQEYMLYRLHGYAYHPRLLEFRTRFKTGFLQQQIERSGGLDDGSESASELLTGYDVYLHFLKEHPVSVSVFASRDRYPVLQLFTDLQTIESERRGAIINLKRGPFPMDLSYTQSEIREHGIDSFSNSKYDILEYTVRNQIGERIRSELRYRMMDYRQSFHANRRDFDIDRRTRLESQDLSFLNTIYLDAARRSSLTSSWRFYDQTGTNEFTNTYWRERLFLRHTPKFSSYYLLNMLNNEFRRSSVETRTAEAGLEYQLFASLLTHLDVHGRWTDFDGSSEDEVGVTGRLDYRKITPWGLLTMGYGRTIDQISRSGDASRGPVVDESLTLNSTRLTYLKEPGVELSSLRVTDAAGVVEYDEAFDFVIETRGQRTGLRLLPSGRLNEGDSVLVDYEVVVTQDIDYQTDYQSLHARYEFERFLKNLAIYYRWQQLEPSEDEIANDLSVLSYNSWLSGFEYRWRWLTWREEYEQYRSNFSEYNQLDSRLEAAWNITRALRLGANVGAISIDYLDEVAEEDTSDIRYGGVSLDGRIRQNGYWRVEARLREETGLIDETLLGILARTGYHWGRLKLEAGGRLEQRERSEHERDRMHLFMQLRWELR